jgi:DNA-binding response OmpR family regulator
VDRSYHEELASYLGNGKRCPDPEEVKKYVYRLRKKVESDLRAPRLIKNVKGFGYQLIFDDDENATQ